MMDIGSLRGRTLLPLEAREIFRNKSGSIRSEARSGVNVPDSAAARDMLEKLPLGQAHLMSFELIPIGPLNPLRQLQGMKANP
jgi:hypothetical protein